MILAYRVFLPLPFGFLSVLWGPCPWRSDAFTRFLSSYGDGACSAASTPGAVLPCAPLCEAYFS